MPTIIAMVGQKGGSGKTTTTLSIAAEAHLRGLKVLIADADPQGSARTWAAVASEMEREIPTVIGVGEGFHDRNQLPLLARDFDLVCIDCPPRHGKLQRAAMMLANLAIVPCPPAALDAWALGETVDLIEEAQTIRPNLKARILITRKQAGTVLGQNSRQFLSESGLSLLKTELGFRVAYQEAPAAGQGITSYDPRGQASDEVRSLVSEVLLLAKVD